MFRKLICMLVVLMSAAVCLTGCLDSGFDFGFSFGTGKAVENKAYIIKAADFPEFEKNMIGVDGKKPKNKNYKVPVVSEATTDETYYVIGHTVAKSSDKNAVKLDGGLIQLVGDNVYNESTIDTYKAFDFLSCKGVALDEDTEVIIEPRETYSNSHRVSVESEATKTEFFVYIEFTVKKEMLLTAHYRMSDANDKDIYASKNVITASAKIYYPQKVTLSDRKIQYLESKDYVDGRYSESALKDTVDMEIGKTYYLVVTVKIKSELEVADGETLTLKARIPHLSLVSGTLDSAGSGNFTETVDDGSKTMEVTFRIPDPESGEKSYSFVYKLTPLTEEGYPTMYFEFYTTAEISVMGGLNEADIKLPFGMEQAGGVR